MAKRRRNNSDDFIYSEDDPIGLTSAFAPIRRDPQAVEYDEDDEPIGLTQAFAAIDTGEGQPAWEKAGKWADFDWDGPVDDGEGQGAWPDEAEGAPADAAAGADADAPARADADAFANTPADAPAEGASDAGADTPAEGAAEATGGQVVAAVIADEADPAGETADLAGEAAPPMPAAAAATTTGAAALSASASDSQSAQSTQPAQQAGGSRRGRHAAPVPELSPRMKKSKRTRRVLIVIVVLLVLIGAALGYFMLRTFVQSQEEAAQQAQEQVAAPKENITETEADDTVETQSQHADVPELTGLFGKTTDDAVAELGRGALVTSNRKVKDKGSAIKRDVSIALTEEPADSKTGTPTVYLGLDKEGKIIQVGYSASAAALGFGSLSFADAVNSEHVIEKTLEKIGVSVKEGAATLPDDKTKYTTYASDKTTVEKERCSFDGKVDIDGARCTWSAVLSYDYTTQIVTGNLSDTVRVIYVYVTK